MASSPTPTVTRRAAETRPSDAKPPHAPAGPTVEGLNRLLADEFVLATKTRNFHWNVTGPTFRELHILFEEQYEALDDAVDELAERVRQLGAHPLATLDALLHAARLREAPADPPPAPAMLEHLLADHERVAHELRDLVQGADETGDLATADLAAGLLRRHEKAAWMLRAAASA